MIMAFVAISLIAFASMLLWTSNNARITSRNNLFNQTEAAAESATEIALASMIRDFAFQNLNPASSYQTNLPDTSSWPIHYQFSDASGNPGRISIGSGTTGWQPLEGLFAGQGGLVQDFTNTATATPLNQSVNLSATVQQTLKFANVPLFQFAVFYNMDLEVNPGSAMIINGRVHSNNRIWATGSSSGSPLTIQGNLDASSGISYTRNTNYDGTDTRTGNVAVTNGVAIGNSASMAMPIGTNNNPETVQALLGIPPAGLAVPDPAGYSTNGTPYLYNSSDIIISNSASGGTNFVVYYNNQYTSPRLAVIPPDVIQTNSVGVVTNSYYSFVTNVTFYDYRESDTVQAVQISVTNLNNWLAGAGATYNTKNVSGSTSKGHPINSVYVFNSVQLSSTQLPAVRLVDGGKLPSAGLTVSTPQALYVKGDYNITTNGVNLAKTLGATTNGNTVPAALMADSITVLSSAWQDSYNASTSLDSRVATPTTVNAAALEGIVQSTLSGRTKMYSGGLENFLRLSEQWSGQTLTYNGSIVVLFPSKYATNAWASASYGVPTRRWGFDLTFQKGAQYLPPLTPTVKYIYRNTWAVK